MSTPPRLSAPERREAILAAAHDLFAERGFRGVTTRELAAAVGVTEPVLYQHFPSKRDLYRALIERKMEKAHGLHEDFRAICRDPQDPKAFLQQLAAMIMAWHQADPSFMRLLLLSSLENHELREMFHERMMNSYFPTLIDAFGKLIQREGLRPVPTEFAVYTFCAMVGQHCMDRLLFRHPLSNASDEQVITHMVDIFLNGLKKESK
jgi:AcrR family transcriptional regulator